MKITTWLAFVGLAATGCSGGGDPVALADSADAGGIVIRAISELEDDSLRVRVRLINENDTSADITLNGGCPISVIAVADEELVWDEREALSCDQPDIPVPFAPGEYKDFFRSVPQDAHPALTGDGDAEVAARVLVAVDREYLVRAAPR